MGGLQDRLRALPQARMRQIRRGVEKESLRALPDGGLALTPHPAAMGSALTHSRITTDFSESQPELITGAHKQMFAVPVTRFEAAPFQSPCQLTRGNAFQNIRVAYFDVRDPLVQ